jgi:hypothetical protein
MYTQILYVIYTKGLRILNVKVWLLKQNLPTSMVYHMHKGGILDVEFGYRKINSHANMEYQSYEWWDFRRGMGLLAVGGAC